MLGRQTLGELVVMIGTTYRGEIARGTGLVARNVDVLG